MVLRASVRICFKRRAPFYTARVGHGNRGKSAGARCLGQWLATDAVVVGSVFEFHGALYSRAAGNVSLER
jgi:hypothetical protein